MTHKVFGKWSFRRSERPSGLEMWEVYPKGDRSRWGKAATLYQASDRTTYVVSMRNQPFDARPSFALAKDLVLERLSGDRVDRG